MPSLKYKNFFLVLYFFLITSSCSHHGDVKSASKFEIKGWSTRLDEDNKTQATSALTQDKFQELDCKTLDTDLKNFEKTDPFEKTDSAANYHSVITLDSNIKYQTHIGWGAALTESSAILFQMMPPKMRHEILMDLFSPSGALKLNMLRVPVGATDFSTHNYSCADETNLENMHPKNKKGKKGRRKQKSVAQLFNFSACMKNILPVLLEIQQIRPDLIIMATPWSPPAWMKTNNSLVGGELRQEYFSQFAEYVILFLEAMKKANLSVKYVSVVNEPLFAGGGTVGYPWIHMPAKAQAEFIGGFLGPLLKEKKLDASVKILGLDDNWDHLDFVKKLLLNSRSKSFMAGTAFHCYGGTYENAAKLLKEFPHQEIHMSECTAGDWDSSFKNSLAWSLKNLFLGHFSSGAQSLIYWNILLNNDHGPKNLGCKNCRGVIEWTSGNKEIHFSPEYYALKHGSSIIDPQAVRIYSSAQKNIPPNQIAYLNPDNSYGWAGFNEHSENKNNKEATSENLFLFKTNNRCFSAKFPTHSFVSMRWSGRN